MSQIYTTGDWTKWKEIGDEPQFVYPLYEEFGDVDTLMVLRKGNVLRSYYELTRPIIGSPDKDYPTCYYIGDVDIHTSGNKTFSTRQYCMLPGYKVGGKMTEKIRYEQYNYVLPGVSSNPVGSPIYTTTGAAVGPENVTLYTSLTTVSANISAGDKVSVTYKTLDAANNRGYVNLYSPVVISAGTNYVIVKKVNDVSPVTYVFSDILGSMFGNFTKSTIKRTAGENKLVTSVIKSTFWWPGKNCKSVIDIPEVDAYEIRDANGSLTDTVTDNTTPNIAQYEAIVGAKQEICIEPSIPVTWRGPIYRRDVRYVRAL